MTTQTHSADSAAVDYCIVGSGPAGCVLANRLTANGRHSAMLLEAGGKDNHPFIHIPAAFIFVYGNKNYNWGFETEPDPNLNNRTIRITQGRVLGGSSSINGMLHVRGQREEFDQWAQMGCQGWSYEDILPYYRKAESYCGSERSATELRGFEGYHGVSDAGDIHPLTRAFVAGAQETGLPFNADINGPTREGASYFQHNRIGRFRSQPAQTYLRAARGRPNLEVKTQALVTRILFEGTRAVGVTYVRDGKSHTVVARKEVLLCAGAIKSPQLLQISGIGDPKTLADIGVTPLVASRGVGRNLRDHFLLTISQRVHGIATLNERARGLRLIGELINYALFARGALTLGTGAASAFFRSRPGLAAPDAQLMFIPGNYGPIPGVLDTEPGMSIGCWPSHPQSCGTVNARGTNPIEQPSIQTNYLSAADDRRVVVECVRKSRAIFSSKAMARWIVGEINPGERVRTENEIVSFAREHGRSGMHLVGTCRMGADELAVVDPHLRLKGATNLRVVDASVMPNCTVGNINATVVAIAERAADLILAAS